MIIASTATKPAAGMTRAFYFALSFDETHRFYTVSPVCPKTGETWDAATFSTEEDAFKDLEWRCSKWGVDLPYSSTEYVMMDDCDHFSREEADKATDLALQTLIRKYGWQGLHSVAEAIDNLETFNTHREAEAFAQTSRNTGTESLIVEMADSLVVLSLPFLNADLETV